MMRGVIAAALLLLLTGGGLGCAKSKRQLDETAPDSRRPQPMSLVMLRAAHGAPKTENPVEGNVFAINEGQRLFDAYNCTGCHFRGGGGIGPALMDDVWIYGKEPADLYNSIVQGRPNGMPAWGGKIPEYQVWQLVAYIQVLAGDRPIASPPGPREEHLQAGEGPRSR